MFATDSEVVLVVQYVPTSPHSEGFALRSAFFGFREPEIGCVYVREGVSAGNGRVCMCQRECVKGGKRARNVSFDVMARSFPKDRPRPAITWTNHWQ